MFREGCVHSVAAMTENQFPESANPHATGIGHAPAKSRLNWPIALGLGSLALLWPLVELTGVGDALGRPATPLAILAAVALTWVAVVGLGRVPRPVLTLTITGVTYGALVIVMGSVFGDRGEQVRGVVSVIAGVFELAQGAACGAVIGLVALAVQRLRGGSR